MSDLIRIFGEIRARKPSVYKGFENGNNEILHKSNKNEEKGNLFMAYSGFITTINELRKHENADRLQVATVFGNDVVVGLGVEVGQRVVYFPTDGKLNYDFAKDNNLLRLKDANGNQIGGYMDADKRNITTIRLRGEKSDGLIMPIESLSKYVDVSTLKDGDKIDTLNGVLICEKYIPRGKVTKPNPNQKAKKVKIVQYPFFEQHADTEQLAYNLGKFREGDVVYITLKLHGTSQRIARTIKKVQPKWYQKLLKLKPKTTWEYVTGTRRVTLDSFDGGFYGDNEFRKQWHEFFESKLHKGEEVFFEVVGYTDTGKLIMPECDNKKTKDKEFIKQYGKTTQFTYGCPVGQSDIYVYRMTLTNEDGHTVDYPTEMVKLRCEQMGAKFVPIYDKFIFTTKEDLMERVEEFGNGIDPIGKTHIKEGVIVRIENREKFTALKYKNFNFKVLEGIIKNDDVLDIEEESSLN